MSPRSVQHARLSSSTVEKASSAAITGRVLLVDDDPGWLDLARHWLKAAGHQVTTRAELKDLLPVVALLNPDCIVLDFDLGGEPADAVCRAVRAQRGLDSVQIIGHTAHPDAKLRMLRLGADQFVEKRTVPDELLEVIQVCLRRKRLDGAVIIHQDLVLEREDRLVLWRGVKTRLTEEQFEFLRLLVAQASQWISAEDVASRLKRDSGCSINAQIQLATRLRKALPTPLGRRIRYSKKLGWIYQTDSANQ